MSLVRSTHVRSTRVRATSAALAAAGALLGITGSTPMARASHLDPPIVTTLRTAMGGEGYLEYQMDPTKARFGEEYTGWVDIRHPSRDGTTQTFDPFDYSNRFVNVKTIIVTDNAGVEARPGGQAANTGIGIRRDFDYSNKIWMQAGLSVIREGGGTITMNGVNGAPNRAWPANDAALDALNALQRSANATTVNTYYLKDIIDANGNHPNGSTGAPAQFGAHVPRNDGVNMA